MPIRRINWGADGSYTTCYSYQTHGVQLTSSMVALDTAPENVKTDIITYSYIRGSVNGSGWAINFGRSVTIHRIAYFMNGARPCNFQSSTDSSDGHDGNWTTVESGYTHVANKFTVKDIPTPTAGNWFRIAGTSGNWDEAMSCYVFYGVDSGLRYQLWDASETAELGDYADVNLGSAYSSANFNATTTFKIKNVDSVAHTYTVSFVRQRVVADTLTETHFSISDDDGVTKVTTFAVPSVAADDFSGTIYVHGVISEEDNITPFDRHFYRVIVEETS